MSRVTKNKWTRVDGKPWWVVLSRSRFPALVYPGRYFLALGHDAGLAAGLILHKVKDAVPEFAQDQKKQHNATSLGFCITVISKIAKVE